jgi:hypothetical protein
MSAIIHTTGSVLSAGYKVQRYSNTSCLTHLLCILIVVFCLSSSLLPTRCRRRCSHIAPTERVARTKYAEQVWWLGRAVPVAENHDGQRHVDRHRACGARGRRALWRQRRGALLKRGVPPARRLEHRQRRGHDGHRGRRRERHVAETRLAGQLVRGRLQRLHEHVQLVAEHAKVTAGVAAVLPLRAPRLRCFVALRPRLSPSSSGSPR